MEHINTSPKGTSHVQQAGTATRTPATQTHVAFWAHAVILLRDEEHQEKLVYVSLLLRKVVPVLSEDQAKTITHTAFRAGEAIVIECPKEIAEFYQEGLTGYGLTVRIEEAR